MSENNDLVADTMLSIQDGTCLGCSDVGFQGFNTREKKTPKVAITLSDGVTCK